MLLSQAKSDIQLYANSDSVAITHDEHTKKEGNIPKR